MKKYKLENIEFRINGIKEAKPDIWLMDKKEKMFIYVEYLGLKRKGFVLRTSSKIELSREISRLVRTILVQKHVKAENARQSHKELDGRDFLFELNQSDDILREIHERSSRCSIIERED